MKKVCYFTSKPATDVRVFEKECVSLVNAGYEVYLISPNAISEKKKGVNIIGVEYTGNGFLSRIFKLPKVLFCAALEINADIYHFNDPTSLWFCDKLKKLKKKIVFDSFEDHPSLVYEKENIPIFFKFIISKLYILFEYHQVKKLDGLIVCYHWTKDRLASACKNADLIFNFPILGKNKSTNLQYLNNGMLCYAGLLSKMWNIEKIVRSLESIGNVKLLLAGHGGGIYLEDVKKNNGWSKVEFIGKINHNEVSQLVYSKSSIAFALLDYIPLTKGKVGNLSNNKLFEYMLAGLPVICTDFILWKEIVNENHCGICINPNSEEEIIRAVEYLLNNPSIAKQMGENGRKIVESKFNWGVEEKKLIKLYQALS